jgi:hypothetical protein
MYKHTLDQEILLMKFGPYDREELSVSNIYEDDEDYESDSYLDEDGNYMDNEYQNSASAVSVDGSGITIDYDTSFDGFLV